MHTHLFLPSLLLLVSLFSPSATAQDYQAYLRQHATAFHPDEPASYALFDSAFYENDVFMLGEVHGYAAPQVLDLALLKHLNQRTGLRYYLAEMDLAQAELVNQYLQTGEKAPLDSLFRGFLLQTNAGTSQWGNREFYAKIVAIRVYNQTRPEALRIQFLGVDWFQQPGMFALPLLKRIVQRCILPDSGDPLLDSLRQLTTGDSLKLGRLLPLSRRILADNASRPAVYRQLFGEQLSAIRQFFTMLTYANTGLSRDDLAARLTGFLVEDRGLSAEKLYGLWGHTHILRAGVGRQATFSGLLAQSGRRVVTMATLFKDSQMLVHRDHLPFFLRKDGQTFSRVGTLNADGPVFKTDGFREVDALSPANQATLFKLDAADSPYRTTLRLVKTGGVTGTKIQPYALSRPSRPIIFSTFS